MFLIPLLVFPFIFAAAAYRLYTVPRQYIAGNLRLARPGLTLRTSLTAGAYLGLLAYLVALPVLAVKALALGPLNLETWLGIGPALAVFPVAYIAAEWTFYYGFQRPSGHARHSHTG
ncbi:MAG TPA: hypothetical protein VGF12_06570 [Roseateles sp.]|uniref:hypothetical protein n=1 Tax=Roseateles sp. TaxID=1971397 RepID=UPI002ED9C85C